MKKPGTRSRHTNRAARLMVEALEWRRLCSGTPLMLSAVPTVTVTQVAAGAGHLSVDNSGGLWYTAADALQALTASGTAQFTVPAASDGSARPIVSNVVFTQDNSAWFAVADQAGNRLERMTAAGVFADVTPVTDATIGQLAVSQDVVWFTQSTPVVSAVGHVEADGRALLIDVSGAPAFAGLTAGPDGNVWFTGNAAGQGVVGKVTRDGTLQEHAALGTVGNIVNGQDGFLYFGGENVIWRADMSGNVSIRARANVAAQGLAKSSDGSLWFIDASHPAHPISCLTRDGNLVQYGSGIQGSPALNSLLSTSDDSLWFTSPGISAGWLGRLERAGNVVTANYLTSAIQGTATYSIALNTNGTVILVLSNTSSDAFGGTTTTTTVVPVTLPQDTTNGQNAAPIAKGRPSNGVYVLSLNAGTSGSEGDRQNSEPKETGGNATTDPGVFEGEFAIRAPASRALPPVNVNHSYYSSSKSPAPVLVPAVNQAETTAAFGEPAVGKTNLTPVAVQTQKTEVVNIQTLSMDNSKALALSPNEAPVQSPMTRVVDWWRLTAVLSAASGLQGWWPSSSRRMYW